MSETTVVAEWTASVQQRAMIDFIDPVSDRYYLMTEVFRYAGTVRADALREATLRMLARHDVLRSLYRADGTFVVPGTADAVIDEVFWILEGPSRVSEAVAAIRESICCPMDLTRERPLRVRLWSSPDATEHVVGLAVHHLCADAWSQVLLHEGLAAAYTEASSGDPAALPTPGQYRDLATISEAGPEALDAWASMLRRPYRGVCEIQARAVDRRGPGSVVVREWAGLAPAVKSAAKEHRVTPFVIGASAFLVALGDVLGDPEVIIGSALAGRTSPAAAESIGYFATSMFLGVDVSAGRSVVIEQVARSVRSWTTGPRIQWEALLSAHEAEDLYPFKFAFQPEHLANRRLRIPGATVVPVHAGAVVDSARRPFDCIASYDRTSVQLQATFRTDVFDRPQAERLIDRFGDELRAVAGAPAHDRGNRP